jgi:hypothetical protein
MSTWTGPHVGYRSLHFLLTDHDPKPLQMSDHALQYEYKSHP